MYMAAVLDVQGHVDRSVRRPHTYLHVGGKNIHLQRHVSLHRRHPCVTHLPGLTVSLEGFAFGPRLWSLDSYIPLVYLRAEGLRSGEILIAASHEALSNGLMSPTESHSLLQRVCAVI